MIPRPPNTLHAFPHAHPHVVVTAGATSVVLLGVGAYLLLRRRPDAEELERRRLEALSDRGRLTVGVLLDARTLDGEESHAPLPEVLVYSYEHAGVTYECAQDVSRLPERVRGFRLGEPVQVRYDPHNPGNSVVVTQTWSGLRSH